MKMASQNRIQLFFFILVLGSIFTTLLAIRSLFVSLVLASVIYFLLVPACDFLERKKFSRLFAVTIPFVVLSVIGGVAIAILAPDVINQFNSLKTQMPEYILGTQKFIQKAEFQLNSALSSLSLDGVVNELESSALSWGQTFFQGLPDFLSASMTVLIMAPFLAFFMLLDGRDFTRKLFALVPNNLFELVVDLNYQINTQIGGFIRARLLETAIVTAVIWIGLLILDFPYALVLSIFAGLLNLIPYVGPVIAAIPAVMIALVNANASDTLWAIIFIYTLAQVVDAVLIVPFLVAKIVNLHPITVVISVILGGKILGVLGMLICIPAASVIKVTLFSIYRHLTGFKS